MIDGVVANRQRSQMLGRLKRWRQLKTATQLMAKQDAQGVLSAEGRELSKGLLQEFRFLEDAMAAMEAEYGMAYEMLQEYFCRGYSITKMAVGWDLSDRTVHRKLAEAVAICAAHAPWLRLDRLTDTYPIRIQQVPPVAGVAAAHS